MTRATRVATGLDRWAADGFAAIGGMRVGLIANPTAVDARLRHAADLIHAAPGPALAACFGPEHGPRGDAQDMIAVGDDVDPATGVPAHTLYGPTEASLRPRPDQLDGLDALVFDIQDVGSRYYTFAATMLYAMEAAAAAGLPFFVLDRPNPIGGALVEGPTVAPGFDSFVGAHPIPIRHGLTVGELARLFRAERSIDVDLAVVPCEGWSRSMLWADTGLPWVMPSPNMPTPDTALVYPGGCLVEGTNLSEGRGTTRPFELWGAPWLDSAGLIAGAAPWSAGALLRPAAFRPTFHKHAGQTCLGVQPHVVDPDAFRPVRCYTALLAAALARDPARFAWRTDPYEFRADPIAIDLLYGSPRERCLIESRPAASDLADLFRAWEADEAEFRDRRRPWLMYP